MDKPWNGLMQLGIVHFMIFPEVMREEGLVMETARRIAEDSFFGVLEIKPVQDENTRQQVKNLLEVSGVEMGMAAQPVLLGQKLNLAAEEEAARQTAVAAVQSAVDQAYFFGAKLLATLDGPNSYPGPEREERAKAQLVKSLGELCTYAEEQACDYLLTISLETFDRAIDKKSLIGPSLEAARLAEEVKRDHANFGLTIDLSHLPLLGESPAQALGAVKDHLVHVHIGNCAYRDPQHPAYGDNHPRFGAPGGENGVEQLVEFLRELFNIGYFSKRLPTRLPVVSFEVKPMPGETSELLIANCKRVFQEAWAKV